MPSSKRLALILILTHFAAGILFLSPSYIRPDSVAVHSWLRSIVVDGDFLFFDEWAGFRMLGDGFAYFKEVTEVGALANHWWIGTSIVTAPFFLVSHALSTLLPGELFPVDGFFGLDLATLAWTSVLFHAIAVAFAWMAVRQLDDARPSSGRTLAFSIVLASLGTPAFWYAFRTPIGTHAAGMMLVGGVTFLCIRPASEEEGGDGSSGTMLLTGLTLGLAIATRIQHVFLVPAVIYAFVAARRTRRDGTIAAAGAAIPLLVQGAAWFAVYGTPFGPVTAGANLEGVTWMPFHRLSFVPVLFSSWHGLFTWSPVWIPALAGMVFLARDEESPLRRRAGLVCLLMFAGELVANSTLDRYWWGGMSFGPRRFVDLTVPVALGLWGLLRRARLTGAIASGLACGWSILLMLGATAGTIDLARYVSLRDLLRGVGAAPSALAFDALRSPVVTPTLLLQSVLALAVVAFVVRIVLWSHRRGSEFASRIALAWVAGCLLVALLAIVPTRGRASAEATRFAVATEAARSAGPLIDQRGLIADELAWLEATGRDAEAARTRDEIARIDTRLRELGVAP